MVPTNFVYDSLRLIRRKRPSKKFSGKEAELQCQKGDEIETSPGEP